MKYYSGNPSFSTQKNLEDTEQQLDEVSVAARTHALISPLMAEGSTQFTTIVFRRQYSLKLDLLEATHYKLSGALAQLSGTTSKSFHRFRDSIGKWKDKVRPHLFWSLWV